MSRSIDPGGAVRLAAAAGALLTAAAVSPAMAGEDAPPARKLLVRAARVYTGAPEGAKVPAFLEPGAFLVVDGRIAEIASSLEKPADAELLDLGSAVVMPGLVDASTTLAGTTPYFNEGDDSSDELRPRGGRGGGVGGGIVWKDEAVSPHFDPGDSFDTFADWRGSLLTGVTTAYLGCGDRRLISGQGAVAKLASREGAAAVIARQVAVEINLGDSSLGPPPRIDPPLPPSADNPIVPGIRQLPTTRVGQLAGIREAFARAKAPPAGDAPLEALADAIRTRRTIRFHAHEAADLVRAVQLARELGHAAVIAGAAEGALVADQLAAARYPVIVEIGLRLRQPPSDRAVDPDDVRLRPETPAELARRGVKVALATPAAGQGGDLLMAAAVALRGGMSTEQAVAAVTRVPAEILGIGHRVGCLLPGKDADFIALSGEPFLSGSHVQKVFVEGRLAADLRATMRVPGSAVVIRAGTVLPASGDPIEDGAVVIVDGRIVAVGSSVPLPPDARIVDAGPDAVITPGFLDCNSHLEIGQDRTGIGAEFDLSQLVAFAGDDALACARGGVTTALVQAWQAHPSGSRVLAVATAGATRAQRIVEPLAALKLNWRGAVDPLVTAERFRGELKKGKDYFDRWNKYLEELKKWEEAQKQKTPEQIAAEKAKGEEAAKKAAEEAVVTTEKKADPVTGKWEVEVSGGPLPEPQKGEMRLKLEGTRVTGSFAALFGSPEEPNALAGTFSGKHLRLEVEIDTPMGNPVIEGDIDPEDTFKGRLSIGPQFGFDVSAKRVEKTYTEVTTVSRKKSKDPEGKPQPPDLQPQLEPYRRVFAGEVPILLECDTAIGIRHALPVFAEHKVELVLMGGEELTRLPEGEWKAVVRGVIVPEQIELTRGAETVVPGAELSARGLPVGFQSHGVNAARGLALNAAFAVRRGMDPRAALRALTIDAARLFHVDDEVGSLQPGRRGDVLVFSGDPFEISTRLLRVFVRGEEIALEVKP